MSEPDDKPNLCAVAISGRTVRGLTRASLAALVQNVLAQEKCPSEFEVSVVLTDDEQISRLHEQYMGIAGPTDVLSFPQDDPADPPESEPLLGDVIISLDTAARQARNHSHCLAEEVRLLAVHGVLHLLGYDDLTEDKRRTMRSKEQLYVPGAFEQAAKQEPAA